MRDRSLVGLLKTQASLPVVRFKECILEGGHLIGV